MLEPILLSCWVGPYRAVLVAARHDSEFGWFVQLGGDSTWQAWPLVGWVECDPGGAPVIVAAPTEDP